jgi:GNAT superfamily N-acetyltransferase
MLIIRDATVDDIPEVDAMVAEYVKGHPAEKHPRSQDTLRKAFFGGSPIAHLLIAERDKRILGMGQWWLIFDMFWGMYGAEAEWLYVRPCFRGTGIAAAIVARICAQARKAGAQFLRGGGDERVSKLYERVAIGQPTRECHLSGEAFHAFADLDRLDPRDIVRGLPARELGLRPANPRST